MEEFKTFILAFIDAWTTYKDHPSKETAESALDIARQLDAHKDKDNVPFTPYDGYEWAAIELLREEEKQ